MSIAASPVGTRKHASKKSKKIQRPTEAAALAHIQASQPKPSVVLLVLPTTPPVIDARARFWQTVGEIVQHFQQTGLYTARTAHRGYRAAHGIADRLSEVGIYCTPAMVTEALGRLEGKAA